MDYKMCLDIQEEYISPVKGYYTDWNPLKNRKNELTDKNLDLEDPWQFKNILIHK
jgi:homospermidine synthase